MTDTNGPKLVSSLWALTAGSLVFVALRLLCKRRYSTGYTLDDYLLTLSWICFCIYASLTTVAYDYGYGQHLADLSPADIVATSKWLGIGQTFMGVGLPLSKTSFAVTLLRIVQRMWQKIALWFFAISLILSFGLLIIFFYVSCNPVQKLWDPTVPGYCWDPHFIIRYSVYVGAYSAVMDIVLAAFPSLVIWNLQMCRKEKVGIIVCMSLGFLAGIVAILKTASITNVAIWQDYTYSGVILSIWAAAEISMTIIATSIPYFRLALKEASIISEGYRSDEYDMKTVRKPSSQGIHNGTRPSVLSTDADRQDMGSIREILAEIKEVRNGDSTKSFRYSGDEEVRIENSRPAL